MRTQEQTTSKRIQTAQPSARWCVQFFGSYGYDHNLLENPI